MDQKLAPRSLTKLMFTGEEDHAQSSWIDFPEPIASIIFYYKKAFMNFQLTILEGEPHNLKESGHFKKLEKQFDTLLSEY
jgi:hypothetical protein